MHPSNTSRPSLHTTSNALYALHTPASFNTLQSTNTLHALHVLPSYAFQRYSPKYRSRAFPDALLHVKKNELGEITGRAREQPASYVRLHDRPGKPVIFILNVYIEISTARWDQDWDFGYNLRAPNQPAHTPPGLETHILGFLSGVRDNYNRIPDLDKYQHQLKMLQSTQMTAYRMANNILPRVKKVLERPDFTLQDVLDAGQEFGNYKQMDKGSTGIYDKKVYSGVYLIVYWDFPPNSQYRGQIPYVGQSIDMAHRGAEHRTRGFNPNASDYNTEHYKCAREARKWRTVRILVQNDPTEGGTAGAAGKLRDIYENTCFVLLRSYHPRAYDVRALPHTGGGKTPEKDLAANMTHIKLGHLYTSIATASFANTGYADPAMRAATSGWTSGLNVATPVDGARGQWEKMPICSQYLPAENRTVFHLPQKIASSLQKGDFKGNSVLIFKKEYYDESGSVNKMVIGWTGPESSLKAGDELYVSWELMDPGYEHPAPVFPMGRIGCWSNWHEIGRLGLKVTFKRSGSTQWYAMYVQYSSWGKAPMAEGVPGASKSYAYGTAILAFLQSTKWGQKPSWIPGFGVPNMVEVQVDRFRKQAACRPVTPSGTLPNITYQPGTAVTLLSNLRVRDDNGAAVGDEQLQNVNGPFAKFDLSWAPGWAKRWLSNRTRCDRDFLGHLSDQVDFSIDKRWAHRSCIPKKDDQGRDTNQCVPCFLRGLPCSWTRPDWLAGPSWHVNTHSVSNHYASARTFSGPLWDLYYESVFGKLTPRVALEPQKVSDPGYVRIQNPEGGKAKDDAMEDESYKKVDELEV
ncbi:hypothetical protein D0866_12195 [Hortaea werneckii]|uniref:Uncharacterized protein n=1 Tax=Hortaea werneckii TaxID=91943 RepID=A0A3M7A2I4_HORWE|nr:hypothetical protein D0866_12195 [Hortaea werneckii]